MFLLRSAVMEDLNDLFKLAQLDVFISLPPNKEMIRETIKSSLKSFKNPDPVLYKNNYMFVMEDLEIKQVIGVSIIHAQHGTPHEPHFFLKVSQEHKYSKTINTGFVHGILQLGYETDGPTEIGGLVLTPSYRNHPDKLGKQLSFTRFLYMAIHPERFKSGIHCELLPPFDEKGNSPLWEAIGRRFLNMDYHEADKLSRKNKEFILSLYPSNTIYVTLLPLEAKNAIGMVGPQTLPVKKMLEAVGFRYIQEVDPFDGGPHYRCLLKDIRPIKGKISGSVINQSGKNFDHSKGQRVLLTVDHPSYDFACVMTQVNIDPEDPNKIVMAPEVHRQFPKMESNIAHLIFI